nr:MAG TPA: hypothetical protein [Caudoviricetes sp.]
MCIRPTTSAVQSKFKFSPPSSNISAKGVEIFALLWYHKKGVYLIPFRRLPPCQRRGLAMLWPSLVQIFAPRFIL